MKAQDQYLKFVRWEVISLQFRQTRPRAGHKLAELFQRRIGVNDQRGERGSSWRFGPLATALNWRCGENRGVRFRIGFGFKPPQIPAAHLRVPDII